MSDSPVRNPRTPEQRARAKAYWKANVRLITILLSVWFFVSIVCSILFVEQLNKFTIGYVPFGFWMAQQGSILVFVALIIIYVVVMDRIEKSYGEDF